MRLRTAAATVTAGTFVLLLTVSGTANAATGDFSYKYVGLDGQPQSDALHDPDSGECVTLAEVADPGASEPAFAPHNNTDEFAMVFTGPGATRQLRPAARQTGLRLPGLAMWMGPPVMPLPRRPTESFRQGRCAQHCS
ncbi:hypothetical protein [Streptomyces melanogenes]|uniref:hypothetical protein n=1 Tax=Streptomyces melanogenes TaxID=67326 RepID=UPI00167D7A80|nr:hypothetical protein [Streptomyces melanogenes]GGP44520.1 hypothetical protein GCM10010278_21480 [Streptomyces melanogenes]